MKYAVFLYILSAGSALAHGGHEAAVTQGDAHWLLQVDHVVVLALVLAMGRLVVRRVSAERRKARRETHGRLL